MSLSRKKIRQAYARLFASDDGRIVLNDIMSRAGITRHLETRNADERAAAEGARAFVFKTILSELSATEEFVQNGVLYRIHQATEARNKVDAGADAEDPLRFAAPSNLMS